MKKYLIITLVVSMIFLCSCRTDELNSSETNTSSKISIGETEYVNEKQSEVIVNDESQNQKTLINVNSQTAKMCFLNSNDTISKIPKEYILEKSSKFEKYKKTNIQNKTVNVLGIEYKDIPYYASEKNQYTGKDYDTFKSDKIEIDVLSNGDVIKFSTDEPIQVFEGEYKHSQELAEKYLKKILPDDKYDLVLLNETIVLDWYTYRFYKTIDGIRTSDSVWITLNSYGELKSYIIKNNGKYDDIVIHGVDKDDLLKKIDNYVNEAYGDMMIEYGISEEGPHYNIFVGNELELSFPIWVKVKTSEGHGYTITEEVVFQLN